MTAPTAETSINPMIELAAGRLALRAMAAHLIASSSNPAATIRGMQAAIDGMAGRAVTMGDVPPELRKAAIDLVRTRASAFFAGFKL